MKKKNEITEEAIILLILFLLSFGIFVYGLGLHNIDLSYNMHRSAIDIGLDGKPSSAREIHQIGSLQIICGELMLISAILLSLILILSKRK